VVAQRDQCGRAAGLVRLHGPALSHRAPESLLAAAVSSRSGR
jgi:hypothetical protein